MGKKIVVIILQVLFFVLIVVGMVMIARSYSYAWGKLFEYQNGLDIIIDDEERILNSFTSIRVVIGAIISMLGIAMSGINYHWLMKILLLPANALSE